MSGGVLCLFPLVVMLVLAVPSVVVAVIVPLLGAIAVASVSVGLRDFIAFAGRPLMAP